MTPIYASLAPMAGYTDTTFRSICASLGASSATSEMISAVALTYKDEKTAALAEITETDPPVFLQIFGHDPAIMAEAAEILLSGGYAGYRYAHAPAGIDINMGCPVRKIVTSGDGSSLMRDIPLAASIAASVKRVCEAHGVPLSVKFRLGWDDAHINAPEFALEMANSGADVITLHCRTKEQMYSPSARPEYCSAVRETLDLHGFPQVSLIGNGDIDSRETAEKYLSLGCSGISIGRAALSDPWLFSALAHPDTHTPPTLDDRIALISDYVTSVVSRIGETRGIRESRSRAAYLLHGIRGGARVRDALNHAETLSSFIEELNKIREI